MSKYIIRTATADDLDCIAEIEETCFPPEEACGRESFAARLAAYPECFWLACVDGRVVVHMNGMATDEPDLTDAMYDDAGMHDPSGAWQMVFGVATMPECRGKGIAGSLIERAIADARARGRKGLVLTCKEHLVGYYAKFGFENEGPTEKSTHGGVTWNQMRLTF